MTTLLHGISRYGTFFHDAGKRPGIDQLNDKFLKMVDEKKVEKVTIDSTKIYITSTEKARTEAIEKNAEGNAGCGGSFGTAQEKKQQEKKRQPDYFTGVVRMAKFFRLFIQSRSGIFPAYSGYDCHRYL